MPYTIAGRNLMLDALKGTNPTTPITHVGLLQAGTPLTGVTGESDTDLFTKTSHGLAAGDLVVFSGITGGTGLVAGRPYFVIASGLTANDFRVSELSGGSTIDFTTDVTAATVTELAELSGGSPAYARKAIAYAAAAGGQIDDTNNGIDIDVPSGATVNYAGYWSAVTAGTLLSITLQTAEGPYGAQGIYRVTDSKQHLNASGGS